MPLENAMRSLADTRNQQINWAIGDLLRQRAARNDWLQCPLLQHLEVGAANLEAWNELFRRTRETLADQDSLRTKAQVLLRPDNANFDHVLDDFIAEMLAAQYLSSLGHSEIRFLSEEEPITADLLSVHNNITYVTEAKNLREPNSLTYVAFARWHHNRVARPDAFKFTVEFLELEDPFEDLTPAQANAVRNLVDALPERQRPSTSLTTLPGGRRVRVRVGEGTGVMLRHGPGPFLVGEVVEECQRAVVIKLLEPARKALTQLYSTAVPTDYRRLLFVRWKTPDEIQAIGEQENVRAAVQNHCEAFIRNFFPNFALTILHTGEEPERTPRANWPGVAM